MIGEKLGLVLLLLSMACVKQELLCVLGLPLQLLVAWLEGLDASPFAIASAACPTSGSVVVCPELLFPGFYYPNYSKQVKGGRPPCGFARRPELPK